MSHRSAGHLRNRIDPVAQQPPQTFQVVSTAREPQPGAHNRNGFALRALKPLDLRARAPQLEDRPFHGRQDCANLSEVSSHRLTVAARQK